MVKLPTEFEPVDTNDSIKKKRSKIKKGFQFEIPTSVMDTHELWYFVEEIEDAGEKDLENLFGKGQDFKDSDRVDMLENVQEELSKRANHVINADERELTDIIQGASIKGVYDREDMLMHIDPYGLIPIEENKNYKKNFGENYMPLKENQDWDSASKEEKELAFNRFLENKFQRNIKNLKNKLLTKKQNKKFVSGKQDLKRINSVIDSYQSILDKKKKELKKIEEKSDKGWEKVMGKKYERPSEPDLEESKRRWGE